jgi:hypothetical protein
VTFSDDNSLRRIYGNWSRNLHEWCLSQLGRRVDSFVHFGNPDWKFSVYSGRAEIEISDAGIPHYIRPPGERSYTINLPRGRDNPTEEQINEIFRNICMGAARVMQIDLGRAQLNRETPQIE